MRTAARVSFWRGTRAKICSGVVGCALYEMALLSGFHVRPSTRRSGSPGGAPPSRRPCGQLSTSSTHSGRRGWRGRGLSAVRSRRARAASMRSRVSWTRCSGRCALIASLKGCHRTRRAGRSPCPSRREVRGRAAHVRPPRGPQLRGPVTAPSSPQPPPWSLSSRLGGAG